MRRVKYSVGRRRSSQPGGRPDNHQACRDEIPKTHRPKPAPSRKHNIKVGATAGYAVGCEKECK